MLKESQVSKEILIDLVKDTQFQNGNSCYSYRISDIDYILP